MTTDIVAILGTHLTEEKAGHLGIYQNVVLWLDPDTAGYNATIEIARKLNECGQKVWVVQSLAEPADLSKEEIQQAYGKRERCTDAQTDPRVASVLDRLSLALKDPRRKQDKEQG